MNHVYLGLLALLLGFAAPAQAFNYHPFHPGLLYQLSEAGTPGDTTHALRLSFAPGPQWPDSTYRLSGRVVSVATRPASCFATQVQRPDGLFGALVIVRHFATMRAEYELRAANGRTFLIKPRAALNQSWAATTAGITARVTARSSTTVFGQPDSVVTITLSDGQVMRIGKRYGWLEGPALGAYLNGQRPRVLTTTALQAERLVLGQPAVGNLAMFDFQPGDVFLRYRKEASVTDGRICSEAWTRDSVRTRTVSRTGDTITYDIWRRVLMRSFGMPTAPAPFCSNTPGSVLAPGYTVTLVVAAADETGLGRLTNTVPNNGANWQTLTLAGVRTAGYFGRKVQRTMSRQACLVATPADSVLLRGVVDHGMTTEYAAGLGMIAQYTGGIYFDNQTSLLGYRKVNLSTSTGVEQWGTLRTFANILKAAEYRPAATTSAFPNPFGSELTVRFAAQRPQAVTLQLHNALGQVVHTASRTAVAGEQQLAVQLPKLTAGVYTLHLQLDGRTEVLRVLRAE